MYRKHKMFIKEDKTLNRKVRKLSQGTSCLQKLKNLQVKQLQKKIASTKTTV